uniref:Uncharacterized protein n=2 Tax=Macaca TaxID=9539 RepID=A0A2K6B453_MACNE|nr:unnamed protein product [Macaca fascicularis]
MRIGDDHRIFHVFSCGDGHLLGSLPTKESVKRQRVVQVEHAVPRGTGLLKKGRAEELVRIPGEGSTAIPTEMAKGTSGKGWP